MPNMLTEMILLLPVLLGWRGVFCLIRKVRQTSLVAASRWAVWAQATLTVAWIWPLVSRGRWLGLGDQWWHLAAVSALCPLIAILGARRGRQWDWSLFVLLPLVAVLEWPALAEWSRSWAGRRLELETPSLLAFFVVLVMGAGNFLGTRWTWSAGCWIAAWGLLVVSLRGSTSQSLRDRDSVQFVSACCLSLFWWCTARAARRPVVGVGWSRVWLDVRDHFGIVWANRLLGRVNEVAAREQWPWRLGADGFLPLATEAGRADDPNSDPRVAQTFRWLLKPFVDSEWIDRRLSEHWQSQGHTTTIPRL